MTSISAHLVVPHADIAADWYGRAFGAREFERVPLPDGRVMSVALRIGDFELDVASEFPAAGIHAPPSTGTGATVLQITTPDAETMWERALAAGAEVRHPFADQFWGERHGQLTDPFGHRWNIARRVRAVPAEEVGAAAAKLFTQPQRDSTE